MLRAFYARPSNQIKGRLLKSRFRCITCLFAAKSIGEKSPLRSLRVNECVCHRSGPLRERADTQPSCVVVFEE